MNINIKYRKGILDLKKKKRNPNSLNRLIRVTVELKQLCTEFLSFLYIPLLKYLYSCLDKLEQMQTKCGIWDNQVMSGQKGDTFGNFSLLIEMGINLSSQSEG